MLHLAIDSRQRAGNENRRPNTTSGPIEINVSVVAPYLGLSF